MRFRCAPPEAPKPDELCTVSLRQVGEDVDILVNGVRIGWLNAACGRLGLDELDCEDRKILAVQGMKFSSEGAIKTY